MIGTTIAHYRIEEKLGEGGMGEVYRAHDTKLNRDVALKILPQVFAQDQEHMARFEREAQVLASLNHSHIAQIPSSWSLDGKNLVIVEQKEGGNRDILQWNRENNEVSTLFGSQYKEYSPEISPDGEWLAYVSNESGQTEVYVANYPGLDRGARRGNESTLGAPGRSSILQKNK